MLNFAGEITVCQQNYRHKTINVEHKDKAGRTKKQRENRLLVAFYGCFLP